MIQFSSFETLLHLQHPEKNLFIRNMCDEGNTPGFRPHSARSNPLGIPRRRKIPPASLQSERPLGLRPHWHRLYALHQMNGSPNSSQTSSSPSSDTTNHSKAKPDSKTLRPSSELGSSTPNLKNTTELLPPESPSFHPLPSNIQMPPTKIRSAQT
jgi:hypothetical protein